MENFTFSIPTKIFFGRNQIKVLARQVQKAGGTRVLITYGSDRVRSSGLLDAVKGKLDERNIYHTTMGGIEPNPRITSVREGVRICREDDIDFILAVGGGSVLDCTKAIAAGACYDGDPWDFNLRKAAISKALPLGSVLTLAATGSESNGNAVISNIETKQKLPIYSPILHPAFSILDPEYTYSVPPYQTAAGVVDIIVHVLEQYFTPTEGVYLQDRICDALVKTCIEYGPKAIENPDDYEARANILWAGTLALNSLISSGRVGDWAVHVIEHEVSAMFDITHGAGLAVLYPHWMEHVMDEGNVDKFFDLAVNVFGVQPSGDKMADAGKGITRLREFFSSIGMPATLAEEKVEEQSLPEMAERAVFFGEPGHFKKLSEADILQILKSSYK
ncbi:iron-containing alcohol dehydrogenase [Limisalsivibrio acetivorans]|uniref:iron-containing alcohol dehydrogenase n=1 Tax=Limisalsivibrio acetivorans TaxID=1304888 RepID=UPI0003B584EA|nr:iron-containing alcohol dehydrogenase [Limisalsivibrio acetivorans]